jgi:cbb3-type cytochrome oxidase cytochrome c subunit
MDKNLTAVEWLIDMHFGGIEQVTPYFKKHIEEAKEMEKKQLEEAELRGKEIIIIKQTEHKGGNE